MVRDTGIGIPSDMIPAPVQRLCSNQRGHGSPLWRHRPGAGHLKQFVELMGGQIEAHSAPGVGSEFVFRIPITVGVTQADMAMLEEPDMPSFNVLVVDDNETNRTVLENMLSAWGMRVTLAHDGGMRSIMLMANAKPGCRFRPGFGRHEHAAPGWAGLAETIKASGRCRI